MRINFGRFSSAAALLAALGVMAAIAPSASADSLSCEINSSISLFPGLSETPTVQSVKITNPGAKLTNCTGTETIVTGGSLWVKGFSAERTKEAITCQALKGPGAALEHPAGPGGNAVFRWHPKIPGHRFSESSGFVNVPITENPVSLSGSINSNTPPDPFSEDEITGSVTEKYSGTCGGKAKVKKGTFTGTITIS
jgi:hypothetical protein